MYILIKISRKIILNDAVFGNLSFFSNIKKLMLEKFKYTRKQTFRLAFALRVDFNVIFLTNIFYTKL